MPRKSTFMDATVARGFMPDCTVVRCDDIYTVVSGQSDDNIICDFIPVLEIKGGCEQDDDKHMVAEMLIPVV